ncbi:MAG: 2-amino-4-hydroxy-6-hydroxymethyldihydropteridine diphosphokinase [Proteobacteria bacterium]|nr:2-amino-4-hydroxy-6-hydroxymethyldihydropteridine diphosphokinase [Pseudomonadota bacterium]
MIPVYIGLGSNVAPLQNLQAAIGKLRLRFGELTVSAAYRNPAEGFKGDDFVNAVAGLVTTAPMSQVLHALRQIELDLGKNLSLPRFAPKVIDLDLLYFGDQIIRHDRLDVPRSDLSRCPYYLRCLMQIAPDWIDPESHKSMNQMWQEFDGVASLEQVELGETARTNTQGKDAVLSMSDLKLAVHLGMPDDERSVRQDVYFSMRIEFGSPPAACAQDSLEGTIDYGVVVLHLQELVAHQQVKTLEHLARQCLEVACEEARKCNISGVTIGVNLRKYPNIEGLIGGAAFELTADL